jgi:hypothetical protein
METHVNNCLYMGTYKNRRISTPGVTPLGFFMDDVYEGISPRVGD